MTTSDQDRAYKSAREKFLGLSLESTRKSYYPQLLKNLEVVKENEQQLQLLIDNMPARISYVDRQKRFVFVNREYEKSFKLKREEMVGRRVKTILGPENYAKIKQGLQEALEGKHIHFETAFTGLEGDIQYLELTYVPDVDAHGVVRGFYALVYDLTDKKRAAQDKADLEAKLQQVQKFKAIGTLAGGVAHDFNNLLMGIQGRASLMALDMEMSDPHREHILAIEEYVQSAMNLTKQLLGFARGGKYEIKATDITELMLNSVEMFGRTHKEITIHTKINQSPLVVEVDKQQIEQVLLNIYVNAWQAMPDGGELYLEARNQALDENYCEPHDIKPGPYAKVSITDTGMGMNHETRQRVFDPFFTTKEKSRGTGLGLASAYGIIKNHGGIITVHSEVYQGTTFNIYLPMSDKESRPEAHLDKRMIKGSETILLVDDEEMIIDVGKAMLEKLGYQVIPCNGGSEAVEKVRQVGNEIDMVILDMIMPGMDGGKTFDGIRDIRPELPVMLSSGYAIDGQATEIMNRGCNGFIQKPFNISELSQTVRQILDKSKTK